MTPRTLSDWLDYIERQHFKSIDMSLDRPRAVAGRMALPRPARHVVTVGGTNGKGSTVAFVEAIARAAGLSVGTYISPHLLRYNERVRIDGVEVDDAALVAAFEAVEVARTGADGTATSLTYFEYGTLAALWLFARRDLDLVVLEVGLGGRLDAVNLVDPDVAVITTVDLDHQPGWATPSRRSAPRRRASPGPGSRWCWATTIRRRACSATPTPSARRRCASAATSSSSRRSTTLRTGPGAK